MEKEKEISEQTLKKKCEQRKKTIHRLIVWTFKWKSKDSWKKSCRYKTEKVAIPPFLYYCEKFSNQMTFCAYLDYNTVFDVKLHGLFLTFQVKFSIRILHQQKNHMHRLWAVWYVVFMRKINFYSKHPCLLCIIYFHPSGFRIGM